MAEVSMSTGMQEEDYIDQLSRILPWHRSFTAHERIFIVFTVSTFVTLIGCALLCLVCPRSPLRRRNSSKRKLDREQLILINATPRKDTLILLPPPSYESIVKTDNITAFNKQSKSRYFELGRKSSYGPASDSDGVRSNGGGEYLPSFNGKIHRPQSARSSLSNGGTLSPATNVYPLPPFAQVNVELNIDLSNKILNIHLTNGEHISAYPAFDEQSDYSIRVQLVNNKILKKFHDAWKKRRSSLQLSTWKKQQEKSTKNLSRTSNDSLICDEYLKFEFNKDDIVSTSLRFLLFCTDRSGVQDLMFEGIIRLNLSMIPTYQQIIQFKDLPQIAFGEIFLGISYLPTSERLTIKANKLRYLCKIDKDQKIDARLIATFFHHGRRFFQKKLPSIIIDGSVSTTNDIYDIKDTITQNIPQNDIQSIHVHFELSIRMLNSKDESIISCSSILLGEHTRYESDWYKMLEQPRQFYLESYQFYG